MKNITFLSIFLMSFAGSLFAVGNEDYKFEEIVTPEYSISCHEDKENKSEVVSKKTTKKQISQKGNTDILITPEENYEFKEIVIPEYSIDCRNLDKKKEDNFDESIDEQEIVELTPEITETDKVQKVERKKGYFRKLWFLVNKILKKIINK
ncbi:hypothetical protein KAH94_04300 [bacterium]|nr:hypothetical protein [bacterium]